MMYRLYVLILALATIVTAGKKLYPFSQMVAFGDNLSDNGNGSYRHGVANFKNPNDKIYGYRTWTNGPVAVSYLSTLLGVPLSQDFAFGHAATGTKVGATINSSYTYSEYAPDGFTQVDNYTSNAPRELIEDTLHFVWIGNNDISLKHIQVWNKQNPKFAKDMSTQMVDLVGRLVHAGSNHVFVVGIYPKNLSPGRKFICQNDAQIANLAAAIVQANSAIKAALQQEFGDKVIYYDVFSKMTEIYNDHATNGINYILPHFCDGFSQEDWNLCMVQGKGDEFYWVEYVDPTTIVHEMVADDMFKQLQKEL